MLAEGSKKTAIGERTIEAPFCAEGEEDFIFNGIDREI
jgi:hypothetical protein